MDAAYYSTVKIVILDLFYLSCVLLIMVACEYWQCNGTCLKLHKGTHHRQYAYIEPCLPLPSGGVQCCLKYHSTGSMYVVVCAPLREISRHA